MVIAEFFIPVAPVAKGRPRFFRRGNFVGTFTPTRTREYESGIKSFALRYVRENRVKMATGPVSIKIDFFMPRPKNHNAARRSIPWHTSRPDFDNLVKAVLDSLNGVFFEDDSQICQEETRKMYANETQQPGLFVSIGSLV